MPIEPSNLDTLGWGLGTRELNGLAWTPVNYVPATNICCIIFKSESSLFIKQILAL